MRTIDFGRPEDVAKTLKALNERTLRRLEKVSGSHPNARQLRAIAKRKRRAEKRKRERDETTG